MIPQPLITNSPNLKNITTIEFLLDKVNSAVCFCVLSIHTYFSVFLLVLFLLIKSHLVNEITIICVND